MNFPMYSYTSNPHCVSRMGTVHYSRNNGNHSAVPMMPMYGGPGQAFVGWVQNKFQNLSPEQKEQITDFAIDQGQQVVQKKLGTGPTPAQTTDPKEKYFTTSTGKSQQIGAKVGATKGLIRTPTLPVGTRRAPVPEDTFLEKISKNRFNIVLASSALLLGVILINRRRQQ